ncbi:hypothetical protein Tco_0611289 [Tanacetum coccineum]
MLGKTPNQVYDPFLKDGLGYKNPKRLKKAIAAQPKMYHGEMLYNNKLKIDSPDSEETLEDAKESRLKMRNKMVQLNYGKLNALDEHLTLKELQQELIETYAYADMRSQNQDLLMTIFELKNKIKTIEKGKNVNTKFDKSDTSGTLLCITQLPKNISVKAKKVSNTKVNADRNSKVKRVLITTPVAAKSKNLRATSVVAKSRLSVAKTPTITNKISSALSLSPDSSQSDPASPLDSCEQEKSKKASFPPKLVPSTESKLELLHMDLCGPMKVESINGSDVNYSNFQDSSEELKEIPSQQDLDNLFFPLYEEYYAPSNSEVLSNSAANTLANTLHHLLQSLLKTVMLRK